MKQYHKLLKNILENGTQKLDRTGTGTLSVFVDTMRFDLSKGFPAVTTKKLAWKAVVTELLWFIEGSGDEKRLKELLHNDYYSEKNTIWSPNANAPYWKPKGLFEGDLGLIYGNMWRKWETDGKKIELVKKRELEESTNIEKDLLNKEYKLRNKIDKDILHLWKKIMKKCLKNKKLSISTDWQNFEIFQREIKSIAGFYSWAKNKKEYDLDCYYYNTFQFGKKSSTFLPVKYVEKMSKEKQKTESYRKVYYIDQLKNLIQEIKDNANSRRHILTAWNPAKLEEMGLPPCHTFSQFEVSNGKLNCMLYCRSQDVFLGTPFNIASYSLFLHMLAQVCGLEVGEYIHVGGDCHIYNNHIEGVKEQLKRKPLELPKLILNPNIKDIDDFTIEDIKLEGYQSYDKIAGTMAV